MTNVNGKRMAGKVALITGGASGIGLATALKFAESGVNVAIAGRNAERGHAAVEQICDKGVQAIFIQTDVSEAAQVEAMVNRVVEVFGRLDYAFNNAANPPANMGMGPLINVTEEQWDRTIDVNLKGVWLAMKYEIPVMLQNGGGAIVNTSSTAGGKGMAGMSAYVASKHGLNGLTKSAALEFAEAGIRINTVMPGPVATPMMEQAEEIMPGAEEMFVSSVPVKRIGQPSEIAEAVVWLCSDAASFVTGTEFPVDGGMLQR